jgi:hypothetical protein
MSIVTLKRKSFAKYNNMSVGSPDGFSLNGTRRNQGYIGQSNVSRFLSRTLMKGNTPKGSGGCCGTYYQPGIVTSAVTSLEDETVVKKSSLTNKGHIDTHYRWIRRGTPYTSVKPDTNLNLNNSQNVYIQHKKKDTINTSCDVVSTEPKSKSAGCDTLSGDQRPRISRLNRHCFNITKPEQSTVEGTTLPYRLAATTQETYIETVHKKCADLDIFYTPKATKGSPIGVCSGAV